MSKEDFSAAAEGAKVPKIQRFESAAARVNIPGEVRSNTCLARVGKIVSEHTYRECEINKTGAPLASSPSG